MPLVVPCPICRKPASWRDNPQRPFCSERCRLVDLGQWADESYRIAGQPAGPVLVDEDDEST